MVRAFFSLRDAEDAIPCFRPRRRKSSPVRFAAVSVPASLPFAPTLRLHCERFCCFRPRRRKTAHPTA